MPRLWKPFRATISFLSDLGGALFFAALAVSFAAVAVGGAVLAALDVLDQPYFTLLMVGIALGAAALAVHLLRDRLMRPGTPAPVAVSPDRALPDLTPNERAAALTRAYQDQFGDSAVQKLREASRRIRGELLDNRLHVERVLGGDPFDSRKFMRSKWISYEKALIAHSDPSPHSDSSQAYRELEALKESSRDDFHVGAGQPLETDLHSAIEAIDKAVKTLEGLNNDWQPVPLRP